LNSAQTVLNSSSSILQLDKATKYITAQVIDVVDGDTIHVLIDKKKKPYV
jgi:hypothetical protein